MEALNNAQREILKLFRNEQPEEELVELKQVLSNYLAEKLTKDVASAIASQKLTAEDTDAWMHEHFRTPYKQ